jgi:hypothetical protein
MVVLLPGSGGLRTNGREVPPSGLKTKQPDLYCPTSLTRGHPPRPLPPSQSPGGEGGPSGLAVFRRLGAAGFAAQPNIANVG